MYSSSFHCNVVLDWACSNESMILHNWLLYFFYYAIIISKQLYSNESKIIPIPLRPFAVHMPLWPFWWFPNCMLPFVLFWKLVSLRPCAHTQKFVIFLHLCTLAQRLAFISCAHASSTSVDASLRPCAFHDFRPYSLVFTFAKQKKKKKEEEEDKISSFHVGSFYYDLKIWNL